MFIIQAIAALATCLIAFYLLMPLISVLLSLPWVFKKQNSQSGNEASIACIITAYKESEIVLPLIDSLVKQEYGNFKVYVVADQCDPKILKFNHPKVEIYFPEKPLGSKVKSILFALDKMGAEHTYVGIFDPDNLAHPKLLYYINQWILKGYKAVQGWRTAKNLDNKYACADAMGELYYDYTTRRVPFAIGSSATVAGSGMFVEKELYELCLKQEDIVNNLEGVIVAEDKSLQADIVGWGLRIAYTHDGIIYDEKVGAGHQVSRQRSRWINSYFQHLKRGVGFFFNGILKISFNKSYFGYLLTYPPMSILMLSAILLIGINLIINPMLSLSLLICVVLFVFNFGLVLFLNNAPREIWASVWGLPFFILNLLAGAAKMKRSNKDFMVTSHTKLMYIEEVIKARRHK